MLPWSTKTINYLAIRQNPRKRAKSAEEAAVFFGEITPNKIFPNHLAHLGQKAKIRTLDKVYCWKKEVNLSQALQVYCSDRLFSAFVQRT